MTPILLHVVPPTLSGTWSLVGIDPSAPQKIVVHGREKEIEISERALVQSGAHVAGGRAEWVNVPAWWQASWVAGFER